MTDRNCELQVDNSDVRVTRWTLAVGDYTGEHRHEHDYVVVPITGGRMHITDADGTKTTSRLAQGVSYFRRAGALHNVLNDGVEVLDFVEVEVVRPSICTQDVPDGRGV